MELFRLERFEISYWMWIAAALVMVFTAIIVARRRQPFYGRLIGAGLFLVLPLLPIPWLHSGLMALAVMLLSMVIDALLDRSSKIIWRAAISVTGLAFVALMLGAARRDTQRNTFAWRLSETSLRLENGLHETIAQVDRRKARILESSHTPDRDWIVKDGSGEQLEVGEFQTYLDKNETRIPAEEVIRRLEAWTGKSRERQ